MKAKKVNELIKDFIVNEKKSDKLKKFHSVMKEFGKGKLKPYHADNPLRSKKQKGTEKERKQALAIAFSEAGIKKKKVNEGIALAKIKEYISPEYIRGMYRTIDLEGNEIQKQISLLNDWNPPYSDHILLRFLAISKKFPVYARMKMSNEDLALAVNKEIQKLYYKNESLLMPSIYEIKTSFKKERIPLTKFDGLTQAAEDFYPFKILDFKQDPGYGYENVFILLIEFLRDKEYGLCIYDTRRKQFIEEPGNLEDYGTSIQKLKQKYNFFNRSYINENINNIDLSNVKNYLNKNGYRFDYKENLYDETKEYYKSNVGNWMSLASDADEIDGEYEPSIKGISAKIIGSNYIIKKEDDNTIILMYENPNPKQNINDDDDDI